MGSGTGPGVHIAGMCIPSMSFADDLALVASSRTDLESLISAIMKWCALFGLKVTKVQ